MPGGMNHDMIMKTLDYGYEKALCGIPGMDTAGKMASDYCARDKTLRDKANSLVNWQVGKAAASGFVTGLGGIITLPIAIPANVAYVLYIQLRMIVAIAVLGDHDIRSDKVKTLCFLCLCGSAVTDIVKNVGIHVGTKFTINIIDKIPGATLTRINQSVGFRLLTKYGQTGAVNFVKLVPVVGGIISGTVDAVTTKTIGKVAINTFIAEEQRD